MRRILRPSIESARRVDPKSVYIGFMALGITAITSLLVGILEDLGVKFDASGFAIFIIPFMFMVYMNSWLYVKFRRYFSFSLKQKSQCFLKVILRQLVSILVLCASWAFILMKFGVFLPFLQVFMVFLAVYVIGLLLPLD